MNNDGLGVIASGSVAPINTDPAATAPPRQVMRPGTGLEWVPKMIQKGVLGQDTPTEVATSALSIAGTVFRMVLMGAAGTVAGMAMAPSHDKRTKYAITGGLLGFFLGPVGIGGQAVYVLSKE